MHVPFLLSLCTILLGYVLKRTGFLKADDSAILSKIIMNLTFPALILLTISTSEMTPDLFMLPSFAIVTGLIGMGIGFLLFRKQHPDTRGLLMMSTMGLNIGLFAFPIIEGLFGKRGLQVAALIDLGNAFMIFGMAYIIGERYAPVNGGRKRSVLQTLSVFSRSIPFMAYLAGLAVNLSGLVLPDFLSLWLGIAGKANQFLVLLVLGLLLSFDWRHHLKSGAVPLFLLRYALGLTASMVIWFFLPLDEVVRKVAALCMILPVGFAVIPYSIQFGYDRETAGGLVNISLIVSFFVMWGLTILL